MTDCIVLRLLAPRVCVMEITIVWRHNCTALLLKNAVWLGRETLVTFGIVRGITIIFFSATLVLMFTIENIFRIYQNCFIQIFVKNLIFFLLKLSVWLHYMYFFLFENHCDRYGPVVGNLFGPSSHIHELKRDSGSIKKIQILYS